MSFAIGYQVKPKTDLSVLGVFPGPTIEANGNDRIVVNVTNLSAFLLASRSSFLAVSKLTYLLANFQCQIQRQFFVPESLGGTFILSFLLTTSSPRALHWHGLPQNGTNYYDGTNGINQCGIPSGQSMLYNFTLNGWSGTTWWREFSLLERRLCFRH